MLHSPAYLLAALAVLGPVTPRVTADHGTRGVPGTYKILICSDACTPQSDLNVLAKGVMVLGAENMTEDEVEGFQRKGFRYAYHGKAGPNACFILFKHLHGRTLAGIKPRGLTQYEANGLGFSFSLYSSADAGYDVVVSTTKRGFRGTGMSWGVGLAEPGRTTDIVVGQWIGEGDYSKCRESTWSE